MHNNVNIVVNITDCRVILYFYPILYANFTPLLGVFRPISLLPILSQVLERHFYLLINEYLSISYPLFNCQWGFQSGKSTVSALWDTTYTWFQLLEKNEEVGAVLFDFKKAFDSVPHSQLLSKLEEIGLNSCIVSWIHNYLANNSMLC